jgi:hypothetical protein
MALPIIFVAVLNFNSPYYRSADSPILPYAVSLFRVREKEREGDIPQLYRFHFFTIGHALFMPKKSRIDAAGALHHIITRGIERGKIFKKVCEILQLRSTELWAPDKQRRRVQARSLFCYWACRELEISMAALSRKLNISESALSLSVKRGEKLAQEKSHSLI